MFTIQYAAHAGITEGSWQLRKRLPSENPDGEVIGLCVLLAGGHGPQAFCEYACMQHDLIGYPWKK